VREVDEFGVFGMFGRADPPCLPFAPSKCSHVCPPCSHTRARTPRTTPPPNTQAAAAKLAASKRAGAASGAASQLPGLSVGNAAAVDAALTAAEGLQDDDVSVGGSWGD
jgi:hypothetical protein